MNNSGSIENAHSLIDALHAAGAISLEQKDTLKKAFSENPAKSAQQLFHASGFFDLTEIAPLSKALQLLAESRLSKEQIAVCVMTILQTGKPLSEALKELEPLAKPEEQSVLPPVIQALKREIDVDLMKVLEQRLTESPEVPWEAHVMALNVLKPRNFEIAKLGQSMIDQGEITKDKFAVALYDELSGMCKFEESLMVRGWWPASRT